MGSKPTDGTKAVALNFTIGSLFFDHPVVPGLTIKAESAFIIQTQVLFVPMVIYVAKA